MALKKNCGQYVKQFQGDKFKAEEVICVLK